MELDHRGLFPTSVRRADTHLAELIHIAPHFDSLDRFAIILEKAIGILGGVLALAVGLVLLIPGVRDNLEETSMRKRAEEALRESEERFRDIAATASDRFWEMDENLHFTSFIEYTGSKTSPALEHFIGRTRWEAVGADPENDDKWRRHREDHLARRPYRDFQFAVTGEDAVTNHLSVSGMPVFDSNGDFKGYRGMTESIAL